MIGARLQLAVGELVVRGKGRRWTGDSLEGAAGENVVGQVEIELAHSDVYVMRVDTELRVHANGRLFQPFAVRALKWNCLEQDHHHQVEPPHFVRLPQTVNASHFALLVRIAQNAIDTLLASHPKHKFLPITGTDILAQLAQQTRGPLLLSLLTFQLQLLLAEQLLIETHSFLILLHKFPLGRLQIEPTVSERFHVRQKGLDEWMKVVLIMFEQSCFSLFSVLGCTICIRVSRIILSSYLRHFFQGPHIAAQSCMERKKVAFYDQRETRASERKSERVKETSAKRDDDWFMSRLRLFSPFSFSFSHLRACHLREITRSWQQRSGGELAGFALPEGRVSSISLAQCCRPTNGQGRTD